MNISSEYEDVFIAVVCSTCGRKYFLTKETDARIAGLCGSVDFKDRIHYIEKNVRCCTNRHYLWMPPMRYLGRDDVEFLEF